MILCDLFKTRQKNRGRLSGIAQSVPILHSLRTPWNISLIRYLSPIFTVVNSTAPIEAEKEIEKWRYCMRLWREAQRCWRSSVRWQGTQGRWREEYWRSFQVKRNRGFVSLRIDTSSTYSDLLDSASFVWPTTPSEVSIKFPLFFKVFLKLPFWSIYYSNCKINLNYRAKNTIKLVLPFGLLPLNIS